MKTKRNKTRVSHILHGVFFTVSSFRWCGYYLSLIITTEYEIAILPKAVPLQIMYYSY